MKLPSSCVDCKHHKVERDPDRLDSFCSDDVKVVCTLVDTPGHTDGPYRTATVACRPYNTRKETTPIPNWCPIADPVTRIAGLDATLKPDSRK